MVEREYATLIESYMVIVLNTQNAVEFTLYTYTLPKNTAYENKKMNKYDKHPP